VNKAIAPVTRSRAIAAARGLVPFDVLITGGTVVDVALGRLRPADVGLVGEMIASVHRPGRFAGCTQRFDATGRYVAPGFMDLHVHFESSMLTPERYAEAVVPRGTTTVFGDPHELANVSGLDGMTYAIEASRSAPLRYIFQAPSCVPPAPGLELSGADFLGPEIGEMLSWADVAGVAEVMDMRGVLDRSPRMVDVVAAGLESGCLVSGHAWGLTGAELQGYAAAGITSDHEISTAADALEKLEAGLTVELRGAVPGVVEPLAAELAAMPGVPPNLVVCTDDIFAHVLIDEGGVDELLRELIRGGLDPIQAIRCATINGAYRLRRSDLGLVAAGRLADLAILSNLPSVRVEDVFVEGRWTASQGRMLDPVVLSDTKAPLRTVKVPPLPADAFKIRVPGVTSGRATLRVVRGVRFRTWDEVEVSVEDGVAQLPPGYVVMASVHRHGRAEPIPACGILGGWGEWTGAVATTVSHDTHNLVVFGREPEDLAAAANALIDSGGGMAVARRGRVIASLDLPVAGLLSDRPIDDLAVEQKRLQTAAFEVGTFATDMYHRPIFQLLAASLACNPGPCVTDIGLVDGTRGERVDPVVSVS
jgi:adenine deaminase